MIESLVSFEGTFHFAKELQYQLRDRRSFETPGGYVEGVHPRSPDSLFTQEEWQNLMNEVLPQLFLTRALDEAGPVPLYKSHPLYAFNLLFTVWPQSNRQPDVVTYIKEFLTQTPEDIHDLMAVCSDTITMDGKTFLANVTARQVATVTKLFDSYFYYEARHALGDESVTSYPGSQNDYAPPSPEDRLRQFVYLYENPESTPPADAANDQ